MDRPPSNLPWVRAAELVIDLDRPIAGRFSGVERAILDRSKDLVETMRREMAAPPAGLAELADTITEGRFRAEAEAVARALGLRWQDVLGASLAYDLVVNFFACSTVAAPSARGPVLARNMDFWPEAELARASVLERFSSQGRERFVLAGWFGGIGLVSGSSTRGFALALNAVGSPESPPDRGYPVMLHLRRVVEDAVDFDDAVRLVREQPLAAACLVTIVGTENQQRVVVERTPMRSAERWGEAGLPLVATNDFRSLGVDARGPGDLGRTACGRFDGLSRFMQDRCEEKSASDTALLYGLSDEHVLSSITAQHTIFRPREGLSSLYVPRRFLT